MPSRDIGKAALRNIVEAYRADAKASFCRGLGAQSPIAGIGFSLPSDAPPPFYFACLVDHDIIAVKFEVRDQLRSWDWLSFNLPLEGGAPNRDFRIPATPCTVFPRFSETSRNLDAPPSGQHHADRMSTVADSGFEALQTIGGLGPFRGTKVSEDRSWFVLRFEDQDSCRDLLRLPQPGQRLYGFSSLLLRHSKFVKALQIEPELRACR
jgi:hypothetical protein